MPKLWKIRLLHLAMPFSTVLFPKMFTSFSKSWFSHSKLSSGHFRFQILSCGFFIDATVKWLIVIACCFEWWAKTRWASSTAGSHAKNYFKVKQCFVSFMLKDNLFSMFFTHSGQWKTNPPLSLPQSVYSRSGMSFLACWRYTFLLNMPSTFIFMFLY